MKLEIEQSGDVIAVKASVEFRGQYGKKEVIDTHMIKEFLKKEKVEFGDCIQSDLVSNENLKKTTGVWKFLKRQSKKEILDELTRLSQEIGEYDLQDDKKSVTVDNKPKRSNRKRKTTGNT